MLSIRIAIALVVLVTLLFAGHEADAKTGHLRKPLPPEQPISCERPWTNAFNPGQAVWGHSAVECTAAVLNEPLFTREGSLFCESDDALIQAMGAMDHNWVYLQAVGYPDRGVPQGTHVGPEFYGCSIYHDGTSVSMLAKEQVDFVIFVKTNVGWTRSDWLRNVPEDKPKSVQTVRPQLCDKHGQHCHYTD